MPSANRTPLRTGTLKCSAISPDQPLSVQEFLHSLKKSTRPFPTPKRSEAPQDSTFTSCQLAVDGFLHGMQKTVTPPYKPVEAGDAPKLQSIASPGHQDLPFVCSGRGLLDPPETIPDQSDGEQVLSPSPDTQGLRSSEPKGSDEKDASMKIPKVVRTYAKKTKPVTPVWDDSSALFLTQYSMHEEALLDGLLDDGSYTSTEQLASREILKDKPGRKHPSVVPSKRKRMPTQDSEEDPRENHSEDDADVGIKEKEKIKKIRRRKRRAPVNELALVTKFPSHEESPAPPAKAPKAYDSDNAIDLLNEYLDGQGFPASTSPSFERGRKSIIANIRKPVTRIRREITLPQREILAREGFKFPPITPRATKSPGWRLGSGFDGITLESSTNKIPQTSRNRKLRHAKTPCFVGRSLPKLELSAGLSPTRYSVGQKGIPRRRKDQGNPAKTKGYEPAMKLGTADGAVEDGLPHSAIKTRGKVSFEKVAGLTLTALPRPSTENDRFQTASPSQRNDVIKDPVQLHQSPTRHLDASQAIREPSNSERKGWLKRRGVNSAVADEDGEEEQLFVHTQRTSGNVSETGKRKWRADLDTNLEDTAQAQHVVHNNSQAFNEEGNQIPPNPERPGNSGQQDMFQGEQSAERHRCRALHDIERQPLNSEEETLGHQSSRCPPEPPSSSKSEADFPNSPLHAKDLSMPKARPHIEVLRTSEVPETQERPQESIEFDHTGIEFLDLGRHPYHIPEMTHDSGRYFSKAVQRLESPEEVPHTITRRKSRREPEPAGMQVMFGTRTGAHHVNVAPITGEEGSRKQEGSLELGVTSRLKRTMSNVSLRPPFKEPLR